MTSSTNPSTLPSIRRVLTGHTADGKSTFIMDEMTTPRLIMPGISQSSFHDLYRTKTVPASIDSEITGLFVDEAKTDLSFMSPEGSTFRCVDYAPGSSSPFHRTVTLDYGIVTKGSIVLELDDGKRTTLNEGDVICQRSAIHKWINESNEWTRIYFVMLGANPVTVNGKELGNEGLKL
ncbi:cupin 2, conserved barrel domain protein [Cyathus striatus]|nr:cupin 2, conserved barrel domain protein [Cyathus striatus]